MPFARRPGTTKATPPTFAEALALVGKELWAQATFYRSPREADMVKVPRALVECLTETLCYAA
jgi:hypothetical protein